MEANIPSVETIKAIVLWLKYECPFTDVLIVVMAESVSSAIEYAE